MGSRVFIIFTAGIMLCSSAIAQDELEEDYSRRTWRYGDKHFINDRFTACKNRQNKNVSCLVYKMMLDENGMATDSALIKQVFFVGSGFTNQHGLSIRDREIVASMPKKFDRPCGELYIPFSSPDTVIKYRDRIHKYVKIKDSYDNSGYLKSQTHIDEGLLGISFAWAGGGNTKLTYTHDSLGNLLYKGRATSHWRWFGKPWKEMVFTYDKSGNMISKTVRINGKKSERSTEVYHYYYTRKK